MIFLKNLAFSKKKQIKSRFILWRSTQFLNVTINGAILYLLFITLMGILYR
jgi:hypothetical protein